MAVKEKNNKPVVKGVDEIDPEVLNGALEALPDDKREIVMRAITVRSTFSGPLPPPVVLKQYNDVLPGAAERILYMAEKEQSSRIEGNEGIRKKEYRSVMTGKAFAFIICLLVIAVVVYALYLGFSWEATFLFGTSLVALCRLFITGKDRKSEADQKQKPKKK